MGNEGGYPESELSQIRTVLNQNRVLNQNCSYQNSIPSGQTNDVDLAAINKKVRRSLESDLDKWRELKSHEAAVKGRSLKKTKRALALKATPFTNLEWPDGSTTYNRPEIRKLVFTHFSNLYAAITRRPPARYTNPDELGILQHEVEHAIVTSTTNISPA
uniref:Uncharacterized protein n=1 Tax=Caenorhabditis japonica TaxID=281687 RepID=A0A8R1IDZ1_CAEJA